MTSWLPLFCLAVAIIMIGGILLDALLTCWEKHKKKRKSKR